MHQLILLCITFSFGNDSYSIRLDNVDCSTSNYLVILQCSFNTFITSNCVNGRDDASVTCCESAKLKLMLVSNCGLTDGLQFGIVMYDSKKFNIIIINVMSNEMDDFKTNR